MKIAYISTCQPRECGLATFNENLLQAVNHYLPFNASGSFMVALNDSDDKYQYDYDNRVKFVIAQEHLADYQAAASFINRSGADMCCIQHEFGIFGGRSGAHLLTLTSALQMPYTVILHTVLERPDPVQLFITRKLADGAAKVIVMSKKAVQLLREAYRIPLGKISSIPHGVPDFEKPDIQTIKQQLELPIGKILLTFGLIGPSKGLETVIRALPTIREQHPDAKYVILGKTHPGVLKRSGEDYRDSLKLLAAQLGVEKHLLFISKFVDEQDLHAYLSACDIYLTPYPNEAQITSGTLSYAVGAGAAVVSTPYWHAQELLKSNRGKLFNFNDHSQLSAIVNNLLSNPAELNKLKQNAFRHGLSLRWPKIGKQYTQLFKANAETTSPTLLTENTLMKVTSLTRPLSWKTY
ncbi:Glycosyltransferase involved in cell wall bisynthesis [Parapedobacter luteus]|uniref:Glycosyltransferase involved in cell wall bisynthesis n=1 Tax=Parapedobacter luteus TaxID=623280 RepID=A0A1T5ET93_9SPHI|nr:glycosyltransferase family 4 protein [Parapedobacter luteus]SKB87156.1 Glycosyltransferase involved in cell wall bisynthesis [Parapedobacter luteus]